MFQDVTTIMLDPVAFKHTIDLLVERYQGQQVDVVAGAPPAGLGRSAHCAASNCGATPAAACHPSISTTYSCGPILPPCRL